MAYAMERVTRIDSHDQLGKNLRACSSQLGCACWSDLLAPRGTIIDSGLGPAKGPACDCCSICCLLAPVSYQRLRKARTDNKIEGINTVSGPTPI